MGIQSCNLNLDKDNRELHPHGTLDFPCAAYLGDYTDREDSAIPWHWHEEMEIAYVNSGQVKLQIPGKTFHLKEGEAFFINSNILHYAIGEPYCQLHSLVFNPALVIGHKESVFALKYIDPLRDSNLVDGYRLSPKNANDKKMITCFIDAYQGNISEQDGFEFIVRENLSRICFYLYDKNKDKIETEDTSPGQDQIRIRRMLDFIHEQYTENINLAQVAEAANIGERECLRCFQRVLQVSPMQYLIKYRIMQGAALLTLLPDSTISDISMQCGFASPSNFTLLFQRFFRCSPRDYRKRQGGL